MDDCVIVARPAANEQCKVMCTAGLANNTTFLYAAISVSIY